MRHARGIQLIPDNIDVLAEVEASALKSMTFAEIMEWERLGGRCARCRHEGLVNSYTMKKEFGRRPLIELQPCLHCMVCDNKSDNRFMISRLGRNV